MMRRLTIVGLCAGLGVMGSAVAADEDKAVQPVPIVSEPVAASGVVPASAPAAASPTATTPPAATAVPATPGAVPTAVQAPAAPRSGVPPGLRQGGDITQCLAAGSEKEIAACAEKYRPKRR